MVAFSYLSRSPIDIRTKLLRKKAMVCVLFFFSDVCDVLNANFQTFAQRRKRVREKRLKNLLENKKRKSIESLSLEADLNLDSTAHIISRNMMGAPYIVERLKKQTSAFKSSESIVVLGKHFKAIKCL